MRLLSCSKLSGHEFSEHLKEVTVKQRGMLSPLLLSATVIFFSSRLFLNSCSADGYNHRSAVLTAWLQTKKLSAPKTNWDSCGIACEHFSAGICQLLDVRFSLFPSLPFSFFIKSLSLRVFNCSSASPLIGCRLKVVFSCSEKTRSFEGLECLPQWISRDMTLWFHQVRPTQRRIYWRSLCHFRPWSLVFVPGWCELLLCHRKMGRFGFAELTFLSLWLLSNMSPRCNDFLHRRNISTQCWLLKAHLTIHCETFLSLRSLC